ncbi:MAG: rRNA pseudouridine synthase [Actinobacteria bacterium]|nr:rRNA pseudouridine synthase [Actinomycetota bacterium]
MQKANIKEAKERLAKYLAKCGIASRRKCEKLILEGKVRVNGKTITDLSFKVSSSDKVEYNGAKVNPETKIVIALNKPKGYLCTVKDNFGRNTVLDLVKKDEEIQKIKHLYPVGRLDFNSRGLLLLTNIGEIAYRITHPKFGIPKVYKVTINSFIDDDKLKKIAKGVKIRGEKRKIIPQKIKVERRENNSSTLLIKIVEGRKRIIRRLFSELGYKVIDLTRIQIGGYKLAGIEEGRYKILGKKEIEKLLQRE